MLQIFLGALEKDGTDLYFIGFQNINQFNRLGNEWIRITDSYENRRKIGADMLDSGKLIDSWKRFERFRTCIGCKKKVDVRKSGGSDSIQVIQAA